MLVLFYMNRCINIITDKALVKENRVLVVVALPCHKADESILTERDLAAGGRGTVRNDIAGINKLADIYYRALIYTGAVV